MVSKTKELPWYYFLFGGVAVVISFIIFHKMNYKTTAKVASSNEDKGFTLGQKNNNPLNIRPSVNKWEGQTDVSSGASGKFAVFKNIEFGYRAAIKLLWTYWDKHDCKTIRKIINRWAPAGVDNNHTKAYIDFVSKDSGILPDTLLNFNSRDDYDKVIVSMSQFESKMRPTKEQLNKAWELAGK
jgi:hypothetical protein